MISRRIGTMPAVIGALCLVAGAQAGPITKKLEPFVADHTLAGAVVLVSSAEKDLDLEAVGWADLAAKTPMRTDCLFWIASMSKPITATALMMLVDEGKVRLDDPVERYLPEFRGQMRVVERSGDLVVLKKPAHPITVREILSHTSGLIGQSPLEEKLDSLPLSTTALTYGLSPLEFEPGSKYEYCNPGINTAGRIIEVVSGKPFDTFLKERLFDPLNMKDTTFWPSDDQLKRLAKSYRPNKSNDGLEELEIEQLTYPLGDRTRRFTYPAGGLFSTAADLAAFCRMILNGGAVGGRRLVSESSIRAMTSTQTGSLLGQDGGGYGLGLNTSRKTAGDGGPVIPGPCGHGGAYSTTMNIDPERHLITVFLVQHAGFPNDAGGKIRETFETAALETFGAHRP